MGKFDKFRNRQNRQNIESTIDKIENEIMLMEKQDNYNLQFINVSKLVKSPLNVFQEYKDSNPEKYQEIKNSIKEYGILNPLKVVLNNNNMYEVLGGWNRTQMIRELIEEGNVRFLEGIPCYVLTNLAEIDQKIIVEIDNTGEGHTSPQEIRESISRLAILYEEKNKQNGTNTSIIKQISQDTGLGERQVQRYNAINKKMITELKEFFDEKKMSIENASKIADLDDEGQKMILELLKQSEDKIKADQIKAVKDIREKEIQEKQKLEEQTTLLKEEKNKIQEETERLLLEKEKEIQEKQKKLSELEEQYNKNIKNINSEEMELIILEKEELEKKLEEQTTLLKEEKNKIQEETKKLIFEKENEILKLKSQLKKEKEFNTEEIELSKKIASTRLNIKTAISTLKLIIEDIQKSEIQAGVKNEIELLKIELSKFS